MRASSVCAKAEVKRALPSRSCWSKQPRSSESIYEQIEQIPLHAKQSRTRPFGREATGACYPGPHSFLMTPSPCWLMLSSVSSWPTRSLSPAHLLSDHGPPRVSDLPLLPMAFHPLWALPMFSPGTLSLPVMLGSMSLAPFTREILTVFLARFTLTGML